MTDHITPSRLTVRGSWARVHSNQSKGGRMAQSAYITVPRLGLILPDVCLMEKSAKPRTSIPAMKIKIVAGDNFSLLVNYRPLTIECILNGMLDAPIGKNHLLDTQAQCFARAQNLLFHPTFGKVN